MSHYEKAVVPVSSDNSQVIVEPVFSEAEVTIRHKDYALLRNKQFDSDYIDRGFTPVVLQRGKQVEKIQFNFCADTFCPNHEQPLTIIEHRGKKSIKNYNYTKNRDTTQIACNIMEGTGSLKPVMTHKTALMSNWSIAEEIKRLIDLDAIQPEEIEYVFHDKTCSSTSTPFDEDGVFIRFGTTPAGSIRYRCKECLKTTAVKPSLDANFNFNQKRNDVLVSLMQDILSHTPVTKICDKNQISPDTFYRKIEVLYHKCLAFNQRHESKLNNLSCDTLYLATDAFIYSLNNIRKRGMGGNRQTPQEKTSALESITSMVATGDVLTNYIYRADLCYDTNITLNDIEADTLNYHCDHSYGHLRKNERIHRFPYKPQPPTTQDKQSFAEYQEELALLEARKHFVDGLHVQRTYTTVAHFHLLRQQLHFNRVVLISDDDLKIKSSVFRVFADMFKSQDAFYFTSQYDKELSRQDAYTASVKSRNELKRWGISRGMSPDNIYAMVVARIALDMRSHNFYKEKVIAGKTYLEPGTNHYQYPLPPLDEGVRYINLISYNETDPDELAVIMSNVNTKVVDNFFQDVRRHINLLERPLSRSGGAKKAYIYTNYNPKYAHMLITIFRTYYNFIKPRKYFGKVKLTPAQKAGIVDKAYSVKDIVYFR